MKNSNEQILGTETNKRISFNIPIPQDIQAIKNIFKQNGYKLYVVGGAVRDAVLGKTPKDYDLATDALPDNVEEMMNTAGLRTLPTGKSFGVINVFTSEGEYEIATFREDIYNNAGNSKLEMPKVDNDGNIISEGGRRPDGVTFTNIEGDVKRRDLTINALFYDIDTREIVDLVGGFDDIKNGVVRTVGAPEDRFGEDRLRILRAIRFAGRFGSDLDVATDAALLKDASLEGISGERIRDEFIKGIQSARSIKEYLKMLDKYKLFDWIFKGLIVNKKFVLVSEEYIVVLAYLLKDNNVEKIGKALNELKYSVEEIKAIKFLLSIMTLNLSNVVSLKKAQEHAGVTLEQIKRFCVLTGDNKFEFFVLVHAFLKFKLTVSGQEVMDRLGIKAGPAVGNAIHLIETDNFKHLLKSSNNEQR